MNACAAITPHEIILEGVSILSVTSRNMDRVEIGVETSEQQLKLESAESTRPSKDRELAGGQ